MLSTWTIIIQNPISKTKSMTWKPKGFKIQVVNVRVGSLHCGGAQSRQSQWGPMEKRTHQFVLYMHKVSALSLKCTFNFCFCTMLVSRRRFSSSRVSVTIDVSVCRPNLSRGRQQRSELGAIAQTPKRQSRIEEGRQSKSARQAVCSQRCYTAGTSIQHWSVDDQTGRVPFPLYI